MCGRAFFEPEAPPPQKIPVRPDPPPDDPHQAPQVQEDASKPTVDFQELIPFGCHRFTLPHRMR